MRRGDTVTLQAGPHLRVTGTVTDAGRDFAVVDNPHQRVAVRVTDRDALTYLHSSRTVDDLVSEALGIAPVPDDA